MTCSTYRDATPRARRSGRRPTRKAIRRGLSLLEVLIAMGVLLIGLLGVGAMIPAGRIEIIQGVKLDYASMVGRSAYRDLKTRGFLNPNNWLDANGKAVFNGTNFTNSPAGFVAIDPLGVFAFNPVVPIFPASAPGVSLTRIYPLAAANAQLADSIFRCGDDLILTDNATSKDAPPTQQMIPPLLPPPWVKRASVGNYSWIATIAPNPNSLVAPTVGTATVCVAVLYKRDMSAVSNGESTASATFINGEVTLTSPARAVKPGQWIMLAGSYTAPNPAAPPGPPTITFTYASWYSVVAADVINGTTQLATLRGPDWNPNITGTTAWIIDNVIGVYERNLELELP